MPLKESLITDNYHRRINEEIEEYVNGPYRLEQAPYDLLDQKHKEIVDACVLETAEEARKAEPLISEDLAQILPIGGENYLMEFHSRLKTVSGLRRKIIADSKDYNGSYRRAAHNICDAIRYTIVIGNDDLYRDSVEEYLHILEDLGYEVVDFRNNWGKPYYQGINTHLASRFDPNMIFELQFHTVQGIEVKEGYTRNLYKVSRSSLAPESLRVKANQLRKYLQSKVPVPKGILGYQYEPEIKRR